MNFAVRREKSKEHRLKSVPLEVNLERRYYERDLPHWQPEGRTLFLTWRLSGSLPAAILTRLKASKTAEMGKRFREYDVALDSASSGPRWLRDERVAEVVAEGIRRVAEDGMGTVHAWVIMPNHVHVLMEPLSSLGPITKKLKGTTARAANSILGRTGKFFWQDESFDHWVRDDVEFAKIKKYVERNPVTAGLVTRDEDWKWSSAGWKKSKEHRLKSVPLKGY